jgi:hypothetical protein
LVWHNGISAAAFKLSNSRYGFVRPSSSHTDTRPDRKFRT